MSFAVSGEVHTQRGVVMRIKHCAVMFVLPALIVMTPVRACSQGGDTIQTNVPALRTVFAHDFTIGCLLSYRNIGFATDPPVPGQSAVITPGGGLLIKFDMNRMSPGNNMKPQYTVDIAGSAAAYTAAGTQQAKDSIDTHPLVAFNGDMIAQLNWAARQGFTFRGHTLVWHNQTPAAFFYSGYTISGTRLPKAKMTERLGNYIEEIIRIIHTGWPGILAAMDVVNEAIDDNTGTVRTTGNDWYTTFGDTTYVMQAFAFARQYAVQYGETGIKLYYNDYNTEVAKKADGIVRLCTPIFQAGYLDGIGMQEHNNLSSPTAQGFIDSYNKFSPICTEMSVTELDVAAGSAAPSAAVLATQANQYAMLFKCFVERSFHSGRGKIINVSKDGLNDQYTFQTNQASSLWDAQNKCKPAFFAVARVGVYYNALDSLISYGDSLKSSDYTSVSWISFTGLLSAARSALTRNYSPSVSADTALAVTEGNLKSAIDGLVRSVNSVDGSGGHTASAFALSQNYPNPFNPSTLISYSIPSGGQASLKVYDVLGKEVATLFEGHRQPGSYTARFDGTGLSSGVYLYRLRAGSMVQTRKLGIVR